MFRADAEITPMRIELPPPPSAAMLVER